MSFDWGEYLGLAEELNGAVARGRRAGTEARQRAAVSRAYYAGFILARNRLRDVDGVQAPSGSNPHFFVAQHYEQARDPARAQIGIELGRLRVARNRCDYDDVVGQLPVLVRRSLMRARQVMADLQSL